jgi:hypothetical protein
MGDIPNLSPDRIAYLQKLVDALQSPEPYTDVELLLENVFQELGTCYLSALCTRDSSMLLETLIGFATPDWTCRFCLDLVGHSWPDLLQNPYASRVYDTCLKVIPRSEVDMTKLVEFVQVFTRSGKVMANLVISPCASQSLKHLIVMLNNFPAIRKTKIHLRHLLLQNIDIIDTAMTTHGSSFLQFLLLDSYHFDGTDHAVPLGHNDPDTWTVTNSEEWESHGGSTEYQLIETTLTLEAKFASLIRSQAASHLFEVLLQVAPRTSFQTVFEQKFRGKLIELIRHPVANFVIQRLIEYSRTEDQFKQIYEEVKSNLAQFFAGRSGVIVKLAHVALRYAFMQPILLQDILAASAIQLKTTVEELKTNGKACEVILVNLANKPQYVFKKKKQFEKEKALAAKTEESEEKGVPLNFSVLGCQLLSELFRFEPKNVVFIVNSFVALEEQLALAMALDRQASRTFESFLLSPKVPFEAKQSFSEKYAADREFVTALALDKSGSHVLDQLFQASAIASKALICDHLITIEKQLMAIHHGKFVLKNCRLSEYKHNREVWNKTESSKLVRKKAFDEILSFKVEEFASSSKDSKSDRKKHSEKKHKKVDSKSDSSKMDVDVSKKHDSTTHHKSQKSEKSEKFEKSANSKDKMKVDKDSTPKKSKTSKGKESEKESASESATKQQREKVEAEPSDRSEPKSSKKRKREESKDDIDDIFDAFEEKPSTVKKSKVKEVSSAAGHAAPSVVAETIPAELLDKEAPMSKLKMKKLAKAEKAAKRAATSS